MNAINKLTPHMQAYSEEFADNGNINWLPYLMYFHPFGFSSPVVNRPSPDYSSSCLICLAGMVQASEIAYDFGV